MTEASASRTVAWALCVATARHAAGLVDVAEVERAAGDVDDWTAAIAMASAQGLLPWLARALPNAHGAVRGAAAEEVARALSLMRHLARITGALRDAGIAALPYKGPLLSLQLYGDLALRQSTDLDLVVSKPDYERARAVLISLGLPPRQGHSVRRERALFGWLGHASFGRDDPFVELHWRFAQSAFPFALTPTEAMARATTATVAGASQSMLARDDLLVTLSMHGVRHLYERLEWLAGVARLVQETRRSDIDAVIARAGVLHARRLLLTSVAIAMRVLEMRGHERWQAALDGDGDAVALATTIAESLVARAVADAVLLEGPALQALYARLMDSPGDRVRLLMRGALLPTEREWQSVRLPDALAGLYYIIRPVRLGVASLLRLVR